MNRNLGVLVLSTVAVMAASACADSQPDASERETSSPTSATQSAPPCDVNIKATAGKLTLEQAEKVMGQELKLCRISTGIPPAMEMMTTSEQTSHKDWARVVAWGSTYLPPGAHESTTTSTYILVNGKWLLSRTVGIAQDAS